MLNRSLQERSQKEEVAEVVGVVEEGQAKGGVCVCVCVCVCVIS